MRVKEKLTKILVIMMLFILIYPYETVLAAVSLDVARKGVVSYAVNFEAKHGSEVSYFCPPSFLYRNAAYLNNTKYNPSTKAEDNQNGKLLLDCVGWTNYCIHNALKLDCGVAGENSMCFAAPPGNGGSVNRTREYFDYHDGTNGVQPGDLIITQTHIMLVTGADEIIHSAYSDRLGKDVWSTSKWNANNVLGYYTFNSKALDAIDAGSIDYGGDPVTVSSSSNSSKKDLNLANFYYNGIPDGKYSVTKSVWEGLIDTLAAIADFLLGIMTMGTRIVFVGWTALIETLITSTIKSITGSDDIESATVTRTNVDSGKNISIEKLVFNEISIFDVNFFNFNDEDPNVTNNP